ncbi:hypothetical protein FHS83_001323 [Rhizomicrobium palustre]|uniref:PNPLA domain-containing protein n=1 Tax=Rhizomicrobium palustre TaxID=189966 RepID=A0A846MXQ3_9PROT|nr:patatin-like phospholipase family protein [Rhizomicrobium palustre]NIK88005.1 hypothetical protein [Rhizomicrobium palustre]
MPQTVQGDTVRILSIDGGGIRGILPAALLQFLEEHTGQRAADLFHLISGTSTGGIICCGLAKGMSAAELGKFYSDHGGAIFHRSLWDRLSHPSLTGPKYNADALEATLKDILGDMRLSDITSTEVLVPTYAIELPEAQQQSGVKSTRTPMFFKSWKARGMGLQSRPNPATGQVQQQTAADFDFFLRDVARATSAAPTYFAPAQITNKAGKRYAAVDGGVFANNPALCALAEAYKLFPGKKNYIVVSLGTGSLERDIPYAAAKDWGEIGWLHPILSILMDGNADTVCYQCDQVLGDHHYRFEVTLGRDPHDPYTVNDDFDDASVDNIARLVRLSGKLVQDSMPRLNELCGLLAPADTAKKAG